MSRKGKYWRCPLCKMAASSLNTVEVLGERVCLKCAETRKELVRETMFGRDEFFKCIDFIETLEETTNEHFRTYPLPAYELDSRLALEKELWKDLTDGIVLRDIHIWDYARMCTVHFGPANVARYISFDVTVSESEEAKNVRSKWMEKDDLEDT